ncbi:MAG: hypothetical protein ACI8SK_001324, partial [Shewanella sp.]
SVADAVEPESAIAVATKDNINLVVFFIIISYFLFLFHLYIL